MLIRCNVFPGDRLTYALYAIAAAAAVLVFGNLAVRLAGGKKIQFTFNMLVLASLLSMFAYMLLTGASGVLLGTFSANPFSLLFASLFTVGLMLVNLIAFPYSDEYGDFAVISSFALAGMYVVASSTSLITIFLGLEMSVLPMVFIILFSTRGLESAAKLFIMAAISIAVLSFAIILAYGSTNSFALSYYGKATLLSFAALLFIASLGFEASIFPFNILVPDIYTGAPAYVTAMLGGINKKVGYVALIQVLVILFATSSTAFMVIAILSVLTMFYGNIVALMQRNTKRMLAYSSISQAGYMLIGIAVSGSSGIAATIFQIFSHLFIFIGMLAVIAVLESRNRSEVDDVIGLSGENRFAAFAMSVFMLSLIGLPMTTGFVGKFLLFMSAVNSGLLWLAIFGIINTAISVFYYARVIMAMYASKEGARPLALPLTVSAAIAVCLVITVLFGIFPAPIAGLANSAASFITSVG